MVQPPGQRIKKNVFDPQSNRATSLQKANSPVKIEVISQWLSDYPNSADREFILNGFTFGFRIPFSGSREPRFAKNHGSATKRPLIVSEKIEKEVSLGRVAGPFTLPPLKNLIVSPLGLVPKSNTGEFRLIFDLSYPHGHSVNDGIKHEDATVQYTRFDAITELVRHEGRGSFLFKIDIQSAFRLMPIHPDDFPLLGMSHLKKYYVDKCLPFGLSVSCKVFEKFSTFLEWALKQYTNSDQIIHYLDDFGACNRDKRDANVMLANAIELFTSMGVPIAHDKIEGPATCITFLGLEVDSESMSVRIPGDKLFELRRLVSQTIGRLGQKITLREIQSLLGKLNFACRAVVPGRAFCRRLIDATKGLSRPYHRRRVTEAMVEDLLVWKTFLESFNGRSFMMDNVDRVVLDLFTDAAAARGFGAYFEGHWAQGPWPEELHRTVAKNDITFKELFPIALSVLLWGEQWSNKKIMFHCDNAAVVTIINNQTSKSEATMHLVRLLVAECLYYNISFRSEHIPGLDNSIADAISRFQIYRFRELAPGADIEPTRIQPHIWQKLLPRSRDWSQQHLHRPLE